MLKDQNQSIAEQAAKTLGITQLVPVIYQDLLQPAAKEAGQKLVVIAKAVGIALAPFESAVWGYDRIKDFLLAKIAVKLSSKKPEDIIPPSQIVAGPVIMNMVFAANAPHLREMYANLVACAMHAPVAEKAHPSFVQIVQQLSPAEAKILELIAKSYSARDVIFRESLFGGQLISKSSQYICSQWHKLCENCGTNDEQLSDAFYYNLLRLGILIERTETEAEFLPEGVTYRGTTDAKVKTKTVTSLMLSDYGDLFLDVCVREK